MSKTVLRFKEKGDSSYYEFIRKLSTDSDIKKRFDKGIFLNYAMLGEKFDSKSRYRTFRQIFTSGEMDNINTLFFNKEKHFQKTFNHQKLKNSWYIKPKYFEWVTELLEDGDYVFYPDKYNQGQFIKEEEFKYLAYKLTEVLVKRKGYNTISRNFFVDREKAVYKSYHQATGRKITKGKLAHMTSILSERDIVYCYRRPNKTNLFVIGKKNPYFQLRNIVTNEDISNIYTKYQIDTTGHFIRQTFGKNLIPGKKEKEYCKQRLEARKKKARQEAVQREQEKEKQKRMHKNSGCLMPEIDRETNKIIDKIISA